ncbi:amidohydrolase family protein [Alicyclobacillus shizuokensis]|uniref:amidohydrolase family protein n=1 Tax=Alicyclobacillus shizuokensis TaxID=392014 RepID=UPI000A6BFF65|nr:amidohydrolase family protein [Alicyclobacillus shizuokensis]
MSTGGLGSSADRAPYDVHTHFIPAAEMEWLRAERRVEAQWEQRTPGKAPFLTVNGKWAFELKPEFVDPGVYLDAQRAAGVVHSLVSPVPQLFLYESEPEVTAEGARVYNDALAAWVREHPQALSALATVPLNRPEWAAEELERAMGCGLLGAIIGPGCGERLLGDEAFRPLLEAADAHGAVLFVHPLLNTDPRIQRRRMPNLIGVPWETTVCAVDLVLSGTLDRYPRIRWLLAHGGGYLPYQMGRLEQGWQVWPGVRAEMSMRPSDYLRRFYYDNVLWDPRSARLLLEVAGAERVLPGSDFPFDLCAWPPAAAQADAAAFLGLAHRQLRTRE